MAYDALSQYDDEEYLTPDDDEDAFASRINSADETTPLVSSATQNHIVLTDNDSYEKSKPFYKVPSILMVYVFCAVDTMCVQVIWPIVELYLTSLGWVSDNNSRFYGYTMAAISIAPVILAPILGGLMGAYGAKTATQVGSLLTLLGCVCVLTYENRGMFLFGYSMIQTLGSLVRVVNQTYLSTATDDKQRLRAMAFAPLSSSLGAIFGPLVVHLCDLIGPSDDKPSHWGTLKIDQYTLSFVFVFGVQVLKMIVLQLAFHPLPWADGRKSRQNNSSSHLNEQPEISDEEFTAVINGEKKVLNPKKHVVWSMLFICTAVFLWCGSVGFYVVSFQPILVHHFNASQGEVANAVLVAAILALIPPMVIASLANRVSSRHMTMFGVSLKFTGMVIFCIPGAGKYALIVGFVLVLKGGLFTFTSSLALYSELLGPRTRPLRMAASPACMALGMCIGSIVGGDQVMEVYGSWLFLCFSGGAFVALCMFAYPPFYKKLDKNNPERLLINAVRAPSSAVQ